MLLVYRAPGVLQEAGRGLSHHCCGCQSFGPTTAALLLASEGSALALDGTVLADAWMAGGPAERHHAAAAAAGEGAGAPGWAACETRLLQQTLRHGV